MKKLDDAVEAEKQSALRLDFKRKEARLKNANKELKAELAATHRQCEQLATENEILLGLSDVAKRRKWSKPQRIDKGDATLVLLWSDWHLEQVVRRREVNGLNEWNPTIAEAAVKEMINRVVRIHLPRYRLAANIKTALIWYGGDFIEGHNRDEQKAYNAMTPVRATQFAYRLLRDATEEFIDRTGLDVLGVASTGNHGRVTEKMWASGRNDTSFETLIYDQLREHFAEHRKVRWHAEEGEMSYVRVYDHQCRFVHGDSIKYRGGRDGLAGPATLQIRKWNDARFADFTFFGDKHTYLWSDQHGFVANGALCGAAPYSLRYGRNEPCQAVAVIDHKRGLTDSAKVFVR